MAITYRKTLFTKKSKISVTFSVTHFSDAFGQRFAEGKSQNIVMLSILEAAPPLLKSGLAASKHYFLYPIQWWFWLKIIDFRFLTDFFPAKPRWKNRKALCKLSNQRFWFFFINQLGLVDHRSCFSPEKCDTVRITHSNIKVFSTFRHVFGCRKLSAAGIFGHDEWHIWNFFKHEEGLLRNWAKTYSAPKSNNAVEEWWEKVVFFYVVFVFCQWYTLGCQELWRWSMALFHNSTEKIKSIRWILEEWLSVDVGISQRSYDGHKSGRGGGNWGATSVP